MKFNLPTLRITILILTGLLIFATTFSQKQTFPGFYIDLKGDTLKGFFTNYREWNLNPNSVSFVDSQSGILSRLTPKQCKAFEIENYDTYLSYHGRRMTNPIEINKVTGENRGDTYDTVETFLRQAATFKQYRFYVYKGEDRINLFYTNADNVIIELQQKAATINNNFWQSMTCQEQLKELFISEASSEKVERIDYTEESLIAFIKSLNSQIKNSKKARVKSDGFLLMVGISVNALKFSGDLAFDYSNKSYPSNVRPVVGIGYKISINRNFNKLFLFPQVKVYSYNHTATTYYNTYSSYPALVNNFKSAAAISVNLHFGFNVVNKSQFTVFIAPGAGITALPGNKQIDHRLFNENDGKLTVTALPGLTSSFGVQAGIISKNKFVLWAQYIAPANVTDFSANRGMLSSIQLGVGYKL